MLQPPALGCTLQEKASGRHLHQTFPKSSLSRFRWRCQRPRYKARQLILTKWWGP